MPQPINIAAPADWNDMIGAQADKAYMHALQSFLASERASGAAICPPEECVFYALERTSFADTRVVIIGQDPYHGPGQAHGLSFSVREGVKIPPSLRNIYKEIARDYGFAPPAHGDLTRWADQGVLLLNATLTVRLGQAGSHQNKGWEDYTDAIIRALNAHHPQRLVFMLWGMFAQKKGAFIDRTRHLVLEAAHPSPLSAHRGFIGCGHFRAANEFLAANGRGEIDWR